VTFGIVALMCEKTIGIVDGGGCAGERGDDGQWAELGGRTAINVVFPDFRVKRLFFSLSSGCLQTSTAGRLNSTV